ncbi:type IV secretory system conjugative DNA transfer family protein [Arhodomonas sp. AD133]|uniref:type IV secretory system conjugative DNA transfer family protein n=1 Tax=Arhodomonas sp. AD133 TaxID=3415009 RepID=UPI003EBA5B65
MTQNGSWGKWLGMGAAGLVAGVLGIGYVGAVWFLWRAGLETNSARPWTLWTYYQAYPDDPHTMKLLQEGLMAGAAAVVAALVAMFMPGKKKVWGDARWARAGEIAKAGLFGKRGIIFGRVGARTLCLEGQEFVGVRAPTRSGKGVSVVIPNLLNFDDSAVVLDIKHENFELTSGFRAACGQACYLFDPVAESGYGHRWNPLAYIAEGPRRINDIQKIAGLIFQEPPGENPMWTSEARDIFLGVVLYLLDTPELPVTMGEVLRQFKTEKPTGDHFAEIVQAHGDRLDPVCVMALSNFAGKAPKEQSGVKSSVTSALSLWMNPMIDAATSGNDFDLRDLRRKRMTIYVGVTPDNLERMAPIVNLFFQQVVDLNTRVLPEHDETLKHQVLLLMDEFPAVGYLGVIAKGVAFLAGYNLRLLPIYQSEAQLRDTYGADPAKNIVDNMAVRVVFPPRDKDDAKDLSEELGDTTVKQVSRTHSKGSTSRNISQTKRAFMLPQELRLLGRDKAIVLARDCRPIKATKIVWFKEEAFTTRRRPAMSLPEIAPVTNEIRGRAEPEVDLDFDAIPFPDEERAMTDEEVEAAAEAFWNMLPAQA